MAVEHTIATIDVSACLDPSTTQEAREKVIAAVKSACSEYGFFQVVGHGVPLTLQHQIIESCRTFFDLPLEEKQALSLKNSPSKRGYERIGEQTLEADALPDMKEGFYVGREIPADQISFLRGPNQWPQTLPKEAFHTPVTAYYEHMLQLGRVILECLVAGLGHDRMVLETFVREPVVNLKLLHYPPHKSVDERQFGAGAHTDFGGITILLQQPGKHGLQVFDYRTAGWIPVPAIEDAFVVNIGDLIQKWTDGLYRSTLHRVINAGDSDRYSVPCFYHGDMKTKNPFKPNSADTETVKEHIRKKFDTSYGSSK